LPVRLRGFGLEKGIDALNFLYDLLKIIGITGVAQKSGFAQKLQSLHKNYKELQRRIEGSFLDCIERPYWNRKVVIPIHKL
jgi:hypothetical protein